MKKRQLCIDDLFKYKGDSRPAFQQPNPNTLMSMKRVPKNATWNTSHEYPSNDTCAVRIRQPPLPLQLMHRSITAKRLSSHVKQTMQRDMFSAMQIHLQTDPSVYGMQHDCISSIHSDFSNEWFCSGSSSSGSVRIFNAVEWSNAHAVQRPRGRVENLGIQLHFTNQSDHGVLSNVNYCLGGHDKLLVSFANRSYLLLYDVNAIAEARLSTAKVTVEELKRSQTVLTSSSDIFDFDFLQNDRRDVVVCGLRSGLLDMKDLRMNNSSSNRSHHMMESPLGQNDVVAESVSTSLSTINNPRSGFGAIGMKSKKRKKLVARPVQRETVNRVVTPIVPSVRTTAATVTQDGSINCCTVSPCGNMVYTGTTKGKVKIHDVRYLASSENTIRTIDLPDAIRRFERSMRDNVHLLRDLDKYNSFKKRMEDSLNDKSSKPSDSDPYLEEIDDFGSFSSGNHSRLNSNHFSANLNQENIVIDCITCNPHHSTMVAFIMGNGKRVGYLDVATGTVKKLFTRTLVNNVANTTAIRSVKGCFLETPGCSRNAFYCFPSLNTGDEYLTILDWSLHSIEELYDETAKDFLCGVKSSAYSMDRCMKISGISSGKGSHTRVSCVTQRKQSGEIIAGTISDSLISFRPAE